MEKSDLKAISESKELIELVSVTPNAEDVIVFCARVSNPENQANMDTAPKLIKYLIKHQHWSPFELASMTLQVKTSRGISPQLLRHRSFTWQEFSQRYSAVGENGLVLYAARRQDSKNRQNSIDDLPQEIKNEWEQRQLTNWKTSFEHYTWALNNGIAKECARFVLPLGVSTTLYMSGNVRSWLTYFMVRMSKETQKEHRDIAIACYETFKKQLPAVALVFEENNPTLFE